MLASSPAPPPAIDNKTACRYAGYVDQLKKPAVKLATLAHSLSFINGLTDVVTLSPFLSKSNQTRSLFTLFDNRHKYEKKKT